MKNKTWVRHDEHYYPNPDIETRIRVQAIGMHSEYKKCRVTLLVMWYFLDLLGVPMDCAISVFSMSGLGYYIDFNISCKN